MYYHTQEENNMPKALGLSSLVMGVLVLIGFFIVFGGEIPQYGMGGIIVNYGTAEEGMGDDFMSVEEPSMDENANNVRPDKIDETNTPVPTPSQQVADKNVATQDMEDAPALPKNEKPVKANADVATVEKKDATPAVNPNALYKGKKNNATSRGDGTGSVAGNQGSALGDPTASNYGEGGSGFGNQPITLASRFWAVSPKIEDKGQFEGKVNVQVRVDKNGNVMYARAGVAGSTYVSSDVIQMLERAFRSAKLNVLQNAPESQTFIVPVNFRLR
ncbi:energy transducer TonB [Sphingobacterium wenxiniae]|uniref:Protein TonB, links inner and outer membranes n=1 Tax=Sphingobacterium wenxiniae TaxID=683125 RepID=A0A1I6V9T3_9SPHI|nr:energy transducer TonB [Sphingobacterium wenxiniae]SFT10395.1 protein TonB, links inner and outer membranes [Sphingobacterium wenxiniae]